MRWVIGDIHGMLQPLKTLLMATRQHDPDARFLFVGDYVNRGPESSGVLDLLIDLKKEGIARFARGNHDDIFDFLLSGRAYADDVASSSPLMTFNWFMQFGLDKTLISYGVDDDELSHLMEQPSLPKLQSIMNAVPDAHREFIRHLEPMLNESDILVAHAMWGIDEPNDPASMNQSLSSRPAVRHRMLWGRYSDAEIGRPKRWMRPAFFGHTPVTNYAVNRGGLNLPVLGPGIVLLDTAAALGPEGRLTAFCVERGVFIQADPKGRLIAGNPAAGSK